MKIKILFTGFLLALLCQTGIAQVKIGYTNIEELIAYMPERKSVEQQLAIFQKKKADQIRVKEDYYKVKLGELEECVANNTCPPDDRDNRAKELGALEQEIMKMAQDAEYELMAKQAELLDPILEKIQNAIDAIAKEKGYTYIINQTTSSGVSTILYGPEEDDITTEVMKRLNITVPTTPSPNGQ